MTRNQGVSRGLLLGMLVVLLLSCGTDASHPASFADGDVEAEADGEHEAEAETSAWALPYVAPDQSGPFRVGAEAMIFQSPAQPGKTLTGTLWYPTEAESGEKYYYQKIFLAKGVLGKAPLAAGGPFPVVVFSHGNQGFAEQSGFLTEFLAGHGFVVAACNHSGNTTGGTDPMWTVAERRPHEISLVLDALSAANSDAASPLYGRLDLGKVAVIGHSFGGYTSLALAGGKVSPQKAAAACLASGSRFCALMGPGAVEQMTANPLSLDPRVRAIVALAPGGWDLFGAEGLAAITIPVMIQHGDLDKTLPIGEESERIFPAIPSADKHYIRIKGAGHFTFSLMCELLKNYGDGCGEGYITSARAYFLINTLSLAKLRVSVFGETRDAYYLSPDYAKTIPEFY